jgi:hypothetical protein
MQDLPLNKNLRKVGAAVLLSAILDPWYPNTKKAIMDWPWPIARCRMLGMYETVPLVLALVLSLWFIGPHARGKGDC